MDMTALLDEVLPDVPGCPRALALDKVREKAREFFRRTGIWLHPAFTDIDIVIGQRDYPLVPVEPLDETSIVGVVQVWITGTRIYKRSRPELIRSYPNFVTQAGPRPVHYYWELDNVVTLFPTPTVEIDGGLQVLAIQAPKIDATVFPDAYYADWRSYIASGAKYELMRIPKKPYSDPQLALFHKDEFETGVTLASGRLNSAGEYSSEDEISVVFGR